MEFEHTIIKFLQTNATTGWLSFFQGVTCLGSFLGFIVCAAIIFPKSKGLLFSLATTFILGSLFNHLLKSLIERPRPFDVYDDIKNYGGEDGYSMPSGHSLCAGIFATHMIVFSFLTIRKKWTRWLATVSLLLAACLVAFSRMVLGVHYLTDTLAGLGLGLVLSIASILITLEILESYAKRRTYEE